MKSTRLLGMAVAMLVTLIAAGCRDSIDQPDGTIFPTAAGTGTASPARPSQTAPAPTATATRAAEPPALSTEVVTEGLVRPTFVTQAGDGSGRLFVTEKRGTIRTVIEGRLQATPFLDISERVDSDANERGLLGLAFDPDFETNGVFFVTYTALNDHVVLAAFRSSSQDRNAGDPASERILLQIPHPRGNHNGGMLAFGTDGFLYMSTGDGGGAGDPDRAAQNLTSLAGKILRLDVSEAADGALNPAPDNPFEGAGGAAPEIWAYGLRNPWRFSFDRATGDLWIGDVGQDAREEVDFQPAGSPGGENYGWSHMEGDRCFRPPSGCTQEGLQPPVHAYDRAHGCSITGGYVYRGSAIPALRGFYLYTDYCDPRLTALALDGAGPAAAFDVGRTPGAISSFGEGADGELYMVSDSAGTLLRIVAAP